MTLIFTDTESLIIKFETENIYKDLVELKNIFDNSETYTAKLVDTINMKVHGKF